MMPIGRKKIQTNYKKIILNNTTNFIFTKLNLITNINNIKNRYVTDYILGLPPQKEIFSIVMKVKNLFDILDSISAEL